MNKLSYRIPLDGRWELVDLYKFPHTYTQIYSVLYVLEQELSKPRSDRRNYEFAKYPWRGGYSTVNWFNGLYHTIPSEHRPRVIEIKYASPGWLDLGLYVSVAISIKCMLVAFSVAGRHLNDTYTKIQQGIYERKLNTLKLRKKEFEIESERVKFVKTSCQEMATLMGFKHLKEVHELTKDPLVSLKMLSALYRRLRTLEEFESAGKTKIKDKNENGA